MADIRTDIIDWLHKQQDWLQKAAEMLLSHGELSDGEVEELLEYLKSDKGKEITSHREFIHLGGTAVASELRLLSIEDIKGIENLSPRAPLSFGNGNLAVIYGSNGSGKSGYTRIFKKVCGKPNAVELKHNVYQSSPPEQRCNIAFSIDGVRNSETWLANTAPILALQSVDIFDEKEATFYLKDKSEVSYTPPPVALFENLARACSRVRAALERQQRQLVSKLPDIPSDYGTTEIARIYKSLHAGQNDEQLESLIDWTEDHQSQLVDLTERLNANPANMARQKRERKRQIDGMLTSLQVAANAVSKDHCSEIQNQNRDAKNKRRIASEAAQATTASAVFDGIGTETWISLWEAARNYSIQHAYIDREFPVVSNGASCVLCHQSLDAEAKERLLSFENYVQGTIETEAKRAESAYQNALSALPKELSEAEIRTQCQAAGLDVEIWPNKLLSFWQSYGKVVEKIKTALPAAVITGLEWSNHLLSELSVLSANLQREIIQNEADAGYLNHDNVVSRKLELEAKRWTSQQADAIHAEVKRREANSQFEEWKRLADTRSISIKAGEISERAITESYIARFNDELKKLGAKQIKVELIKSGTDRGKAKHQIRLQGVVAKGATPDTILSDGERRIVSLAAFLADTTGRPQNTPFIFDDPISSLDHDFEGHVAERLAHLAQTRQVLVFTHRLSLCGAMADAAKKVGEQFKKDHLQQYCIVSLFDGTSGHPVNQNFGMAANTRTANNILIGMLNEARKYWDAGDRENYLIHGQSICAKFRILIENTIEKDLLHEVVMRHRRNIHTNNVIMYLSKISHEDCRYIDRLMTKYSAYLHSQSNETPVSIPDEPDLRLDLEGLLRWREEFKKRSIDS
ncbi:MAG: AAA family ATPase [Betaproteobacteria bacterium]|nr:AAA family ATPase [Betaproteobacteria bacterium]